MVYWNLVIDFFWFYFVWFFIIMIGSLLSISKKKIKKNFVWKLKINLFKIIFKWLVYILNILSYEI